MQTLNEQDMLNILSGTSAGSVVFVSYLAGRPPTARALQEAQPAIDAGLNRRHFVGTLEGVRWTKQNQLVMTVLCDNRYHAHTQSPRYRTFNPSLGRLLFLAVLHSSEQN